VSEEAALLALLRDPNDAVARVVYADWLEESGNVSRAELLRATHALEQMTLDSQLVVEQARALIEAREREDAAWLAAVDRRALLVGTVWATKSNSGEAALIAFHPDGKATFRRATGSWPGTWATMGNAVSFTINDYSPHVGVYFGDRMTGAAWNRANQKWTWGAVRMAIAADDAAPFPEVPEDTPRDSDYGPAKPRRVRRASAGGGT
jgi:uncharacterized protein (TIGR02996 family)